MNLLIKLPSRQRPQKLLNIVSAYQQMRTNENTKFLLTLDEDDEMTNTPHVRKVLGLWGNVTVVWGTSRTKIEAVNRDLPTYDQSWDVVLLASDDMHPVVKGYDQIILDKMAEHYPDKDGVLWFNDGFVGNRLNTLCILGRKYYDRDGYIYNPEYTSLWCDNEFMDVANLRGKQTYIDQVIIEHRHPMNTVGTRLDALYNRNDKFYQSDKAIYERRKAAGFGLTKTAA